MVRDRHRRWVVAGMGGSHGRRKQKHDHDGRRSHKTRKSQLDSHAFTYHGPAILTRCIRGLSGSRVFPFPEAAFYKSSSRIVTGSTFRDIDDSFGKGLRSFLRQVVPDAARDEPVRVFAGEFLRVGLGSGAVRRWRRFPA